MKHAVKRLGIGALVASGLLLTSQSAAAAAPPEGGGTAMTAVAPEPKPGTYTGHGFTIDPTARAAAASVPPAPCVTAALDPPGYVTQTVHVKNGCPNQQRVQVLARYQPDSPCFIIDARGQVDYALSRSSLNSNPFDGLQAC